ncbi:MAG: bile acid:sodium symporter family protein [Alphaproteobacteria bacterium]|nr:bile acid:sodium symporter family protein [Alphaproteobacteria bacterium]
MGILTDVFLPLSLAFIMFSMGLALVIDDFRRVVTAPKAFAVGALAQMVLLPLVGFSIVTVWHVEPAVAVGVVLIAACPSGVTSNLLTHLARGDTALAISLTAVISVASVVSLPVIVNLALAQFLGVTSAVELPIARTIVSIFLITTVPVAIGMAVKHWRGGFADRFEPIARRIATILFIVIVLAAIYQERANVVRYFTAAGPITLALNIVMMAVGFYLARLFMLNRAQSIAISIETGIQNATLAIFVATTLLRSTEIAVPGAIYGLLMFVTAGVFVVMVRREQPAAAT